MKNKLFDVVDGEPKINAPLINIKCFRKLWENDSTEDKSMYKKHLLYIYHTCDYRSHLFDAASQNKLKDINQEVYGRTTNHVSAVLAKCIEEYKKRNTIAEQRSLEASIVNADAISKSMSAFQQDDTEFNKIIKEIDMALKDKDISLETKMTLLEKKMDLRTKHVALATKATELIPKMEKTLESIINMRRKVEESIDKISDNREAIENYIIDELIFLKESDTFVN